MPVTYEQLLQWLIGVHFRAEDAEKCQNIQDSTELNAKVPPESVPPEVLLAQTHQAKNKVCFEIASL